MESTSTGGNFEAIETPTAILPPDLSEQSEKEPVQYFNLAFRAVQIIQVYRNLV